MGTSLAIHAEINSAINNDWKRMARPGSFFTGAQRVAMATEARRDRDGDPTGTGQLSPTVARVVRQVSVRPMDITHQWVDQAFSEGLTPLQYVEIIGLVSRLSAIDLFDFGIGSDQRPLPDPVAGEPTGAFDPAAQPNGAVVPTTGPSGASVALTGIRAENAALHEIHEAFFISNTQIPEFGLTKDLIRPQMEMVAARTSYLNDCFY
jgi:hypothetical protein